MFRPIRGVLAWWLPSAGAAFGAVVVVVFIVAGEIARPAPPPGRDTLPEPLRRADGAVHLAGSEIWLPLASSLVEAFGRSRPDAPVVVHESIGSSGGRRAIEDGIIDIGLIAHPIGERIALDGYREIPIALTAIVVAVNASVATTSVQRRQVVAIYEGRMQRWPDGQAIVPLLRERDDSATRVAEKAVPGLGPALRVARLRDASPTFLDDEDFERALRSTPGAIGFVDLGTIVLEDLPIGALALDGVVPTAESVASGRYPLRCELAMLVSRDPRPGTRAFVEFVRSSHGHAAIAHSGAYHPVVEEPL